METLWRLRRLQASLLDPGAPSALLFVAGVDGRDNWGTTSLLDWLLVNDTDELLVPRDVEEAALTRKSVIPKEGAEAEALEETVILVRARSAAIFYDPRCESILSPLLDAPGVHEYTLSSGASEDGEIAEAEKAAAFVAMVGSWLLDADSVGVVLPRGSTDPREEIEYWPLVQAYAALKTMSGAKEPFLSMRHSVLDASMLLKSCLQSSDGPKLRGSLQRATNGLRRHVDDTWRLLTGATLKNRPDLSAEDVEDRIVSYFDYGRDDEEVPEEEQEAGSMQGAFALLGESSCALTGGKEGKKTTTLTSTHVVLQAEDGASGIRVCRTYLLAKGISALQDADQKYAEILALLHSLPHKISSGKNLQASLRSLEAANLGVVAHADVIKKNMGVVQLVYLRLAASFGKGGAVAVGDTFLLNLTGESSLLPHLQQGECGLVTGERCAPYHRLMWRSGGEEAKAAAETLHKLRDPHLVREELSLGHKTAGPFAAATMIVEEQSGRRWAVTGKLEVFKGGFALLDTGCAPLVVSLARGAARGVQLRQRGKQALFLFQNLKTNALPFLLDDDSSDVAIAALVVKAHGEAHRAVDDQLGNWRAEARIANDEEANGGLENFEAAFDELWADQNDLLQSRLSFMPKVEDLIAKFSAMDQTKIASQLTCEKEQGVVKKEKVCALLGLPGSGVLELATCVAARGKEDDGRGWLLVEAVLDDELLLDSRATRDLLSLKSDGKNRILVCAATVSGARELTACLSIYEECSIVVVVSAAQLAAPAGLCKWPLGLVDQCAPAYAAALCVVDGSADAASGLSRKLRRSNIVNRRRLPLVRWSRGSRETSAVADALRTAKDVGMAELRETMDRGIVPPTQKAPRRRVVRVDLGSLALERQLLLLVLKEVLLRPDAKIRERLALSETTSSTEGGPALKRLLRLAELKVERSTNLESRVAEWPARLASWRSKHPATAQALTHLTAVSGLVDLRANSEEQEDDSLALIEALNGQLCSIWTAPASLNKGLHMLFVSDTDSNLDAEAFEDLLAIAATSSTHRRTRRTRESVTEAEYALVAQRAERRNPPLPTGYAFDGRNYVDSYGNASRLRPDMEAIIEDWLNDQNAKIDQNNKHQH